MNTAAADTPVAGQVAARPPVNRMGIAVLSLVGILIAGYMLLYKLGVIGTLVCGEGSCSTVQESPWAVFLGVPVPAWGVAGYGAIFVLSLVGLQGGFVRDRRLGLLLVALGTVAFGFSAYLTGIEAFVIHAWCRWCVASAVLATLIFVLSLAELRRRGAGNV
ncbi:MAG TPA: vitamin K epoxide reductase family protein [Longimicrobiales bacterium]